MESFSLEDVKQRLKDQTYQAALSGGTVSPPIQIQTTKSKVKHNVDILYRGVSIGFLVALTDSFNLADYETYRVVKEFITPITANPKSAPDDNDGDHHDGSPCRFSELIYFSQYFGKADTFVSHCWRGKWGDLVAAVSNGYPLSRKVWIDVFAVTQHPQLEALQDDLNALEYVLESVSQGTTLVWNPLIQTDNTSNPLLRAWCLFEIHITVIKENALVIKMGQQGGNFSTTDEGVAVDFIPQNDEDVVTGLVFQTDIRKAKASVPEDLERIHAMIQKQGGFDELNTRVRTAVYNNWRILQIPAVREALSGSKDKLRESIANHDPATYGGDPGGSVLHDCVHGNFVNAAKLAIECGADIDKQTDKGNTALMFAAEGGRTKMCLLLLESGASLNLQNEREESALHLAAKYGRVEAVKLLLQSGADAKLLESGNYTPAGLAGLNKMPGCKDVLKILQQHEFSSRSRSLFFCCFAE